MNQNIKKILSLFACSTVVLGSTNTANAAAINVADTAIVTHQTTNIDAAVITFTSATDTGNDQTFVATLNAATAFSVANMTDADGLHDPVITVDNGIVTVTANIDGIAATATDVLKFDVKNDGGLKVAGDITVASNKTVTMEVENGGTIELSGASAQAIAATIQSDGNNAGALTLSGAGKKTFAAVVGGGGTGELGTLTVSASSEGEFNATLDAIAITVASTGTLQIDAASNANTIANSGTLKVNHTLDDIAANGLTAITMTGTGSILSLNSIAGVDHDISVVATADGDGTINVIDLSGGAAAAVQALSGGDIGTTSKRIGTLNVGSTALNGALTTIDGDAIFVDDLNVVGGNATNEHSILSIVENVTTTNGMVLTAAGTGNAELSFDTTASTVAGTVDSGSGTAGGGTTLIDVNIAATFTDNVGATTAIELMTIADSVTANLDGTTNEITSVVMTDDSTIEFDAGGDQTFTGVITATADVDGTIINANTDGELTITGAIGTATKGVTEITLADGANTNFNSAIFARTLDINTNGETTVFEVGGNEIGDTGGNAGALEIVAGAVIELGTAIGNGTTVFATDTVDAGGDGVAIAGDFTIKPSANFTSGTIVLIQGDSADISSAEKADILVQDTALTNFVVDDGGGTATHDIGITANAKSDAASSKEISVTLNDVKGLRQAIDAVANDSDALTALNNSLVGINGRTSADVTALSKQVAPQTDLISGSSVAAQAVTGSIQGIMSNRMASLRSGDAYFGTGVSAGGMSAQSGFIQIFGSEAEQKSTKVGSGTQAGYDSDSAGIAVGFDGVSDDGMTIGVSVATANTDVDGKGTGKSKNSIDTYSASVYMDKTTDSGYVEGSVTFGVNENTTSRIVNSAGLNRSYTGSYDSQQLALSISAGAPIDAGNGYLTPFGSFTATTFDIDAYTEKSNVVDDALRLKVAQDDINSMVGTVGLKYHADMGNGGSPMISLAINNEFGDNTINSTNTFQGGGTAFKTSTAVEELSATLGLGYSYGSDSAAIEFAYEADANEDDYLSHYGSFKIVGKF
jgi:uncharacterized protein with beta-barrel porin domain